MRFRKGSLHANTGFPSGQHMFFFTMDSNSGIWAVGVHCAL